MSEVVAPAVEGEVVAPPVVAPAAPPAGGQTDTAPVGADTSSAPAAPASDIIRPEGLPDQFWEDGKGVKTGDLWVAFQELQTKTEAAKADLPADPSGYELKLSDDVKVPDGFKVEIDAKDPFFAEVTKDLHGLGVGKAGVQKLVDAYARMQIADQTQATETYAAEKAKLGANADARLKAATDWLGANLTKEQAAAIGGSLYSAVGIQALEKIISLRADPKAGQGGGASITSLDGLRGGDMLDAIRTKAA